MKRDGGAESCGSKKKENEKKTASKKLEKKSAAMFLWVHFPEQHSYFYDEAAFTAPDYTVQYLEKMLPTV